MENIILVPAPPPPSSTAPEPPRRPDRDTALALINGVLAGVGAMYAGTHSALATVIATAAALTLVTMMIMADRYPAGARDTAGQPAKGNFGPRPHAWARARTYLCDRDEHHRACTDREAATLAAPPRATMQAGDCPAAAIRLPAPPGFEEFFRESFRKLVAVAMHHGATQQEAEDAAAKTLGDLLAVWEPGKYSLAYARRAVINNFFKAKQRGIRRVAQRLIDRGHVPRQEGAEDGRLSEWEDEQWINGVLRELPTAQRAVMECSISGLDDEEIAQKLGKSKDAVRRSRCDAIHSLRNLLKPDGEYRQPARTTTQSSREEAR